MIKHNVCSPDKWLDFARQYIAIQETKHNKWVSLSSFVNYLSLFNIMVGMNGQGKGVRNLSLYYVPDMSDSKNRTWLCHIKLFQREPQSEKYLFKDLLEVTFWHRVYRHTPGNGHFEDIVAKKTKKKVDKTSSQIYISIEFNSGFDILKESIEQYIKELSQTTVNNQG